MGARQVVETGLELWLGLSFWARIGVRIRTDLSSPHIFDFEILHENSHQHANSHQPSCATGRE